MLPGTVLPGTGRPAASGPDDIELTVLPGLREPRLVVPRDRRASAAALRGYGVPGSPLARVAARTLAVALRAGAGRLVPHDRLAVRVPAGAPTIESHLRAVLGRPVLVSMHLGAPRANRKPVLQVLTPAGGTIAYAKIGVNSLTSSLVQAEHDALTRLAAAGLSLHLGPLVPSAYWTLLRARLDTTPAGPEVAELRMALGELAARHGMTTLSFGATHGDWTPWNMASTAAGLLVWDWERFAPHSPVGFDALHYWLQARVTSGHADPATAAAHCVEQAPVLLAPLRIPQPQARLTALVYLADLSVRYLADGQEQAGARLGAPGRWLLPALRAATIRKDCSPSPGQ